MTSFLTAQSLSGPSDHISRTPGVCDGRPCVAGTRIRVYDIHVWHNLRGQSAQEIVASFPQLSLADVYAALAYYHDHREEIQADVREAQELVKQLRSEQGSTVLGSVVDGDDAVPSR